MARASLAQLSDGHLLFLLHDQSVLLLCILRLESLPRESALEEVDQHVADRLKVIASALFDAQMVVDGCIARGACQRPTIPMRDVVEVLGVSVSFG